MTTDKLYAAPERRVVVVEVPELQFLMTDGTGDPNGLEFQEAVHALYRASYAIRFRLKRDGYVHKVGHLEALWDLDWSWTAMIAQPDVVTPGLLRELKIDPRLRLEPWAEGLALQTLHVGPYVSEERAVALLAAYAGEHAYEFSGRHHEVYLTDPRRTPPERWRTIIRHPVARASEVAASVLGRSESREERPPKAVAFDAEVVEQLADSALVGLD